MIHLAIYDRSVKEQLKANPKGLGEVKLVPAPGVVPPFGGPRGEGVDAVVVGLDQLGEDPRAALDDLVDRHEAEFALVLYHFARRDIIDRLSKGRARVLKAPVQLAVLRMHLMALVVRNIVKSGSYRAPRSIGHA